MIIHANVRNGHQQNNVTVETDGSKKEIEIPAKVTGQGLSVNGGELLFLALATCICNDVYREAVRRKIMIHEVYVNVSGEFGMEGEAASNIQYKVKIASDSPADEIDALIVYVDKVAEIHNTLRRGVNVSLVTFD